MKSGGMVAVGPLFVVIVSSHIALAGLNTATTKERHNGWSTYGEEVVVTFPFAGPCS